MSNGNPPPECPTGSCGYGVQGGSGDCDGGNSSCANARLAMPDTPFDGQTDALRNVTERINERLGSLGPDAEGRKLSFLRTPIGITLGWIRHREDAEHQDPNPDQVRADDPRVIDELMIDRRTTPGDESAAGMWEYHSSDDGIECRPGTDATCWLGPFLVADTNASYHPPEVRKVVEFIIGELHELEKDAGGRKLALIRNGDGMMLSWVTQKVQTAPTAA